MHIINFLIAIFIPYFSLFHRIGPTGIVPTYFFSREAAYLSSLGGSIVFFWLGYLRYKVEDGKWTELRYFTLFGVFLAFSFVSKLVLTLPYAWFNLIVGFGMGWLSIAYGQRYGKSIYVLTLASTYFIGLSLFILLGMAWFDLEPEDYYLYKNYLWEFILQTITEIQEFVTNLI